VSMNSDSLGSCEDPANIRSSSQLEVVELAVESPTFICAFNALLSEMLTEAFEHLPLAACFRG
jgi:hypothetical protein